MCALLEMNEAPVVDEFGASDKEIHRAMDGERDRNL